MKAAKESGKGSRPARTGDVCRRSRVEKLAVAQELIYDAWEERDRSKRVALARLALRTSPLCADAYVILAEQGARSPRAMLSYYEKGVKAGKQALAGGGFAENIGQFWGVLETRPYMRARAGMAEVLWKMGRNAEAIEHYQAMLVLDPMDNQGLRFRLADWLMESAKFQDFARLISSYSNDEWRVEDVEIDDDL